MELEVELSELDEGTELEIELVELLTKLLVELEEV